MEQETNHPNILWPYILWASRGFCSHTKRHQHQHQHQHHHQQQQQQRRQQNKQEHNYPANGVSFRNMEKLIYYKRTRCCWETILSSEASPRDNNRLIVASWPSGKKGWNCWLPRFSMTPCLSHHYGPYPWQAPTLWRISCHLPIFSWICTQESLQNEIEMALERCCPKICSVRIASPFGCKICTPYAALVWCKKYYVHRGRCDGVSKTQTVFDGCYEKGFSNRNININIDINNNSSSNNNNHNSDSDDSHNHNPTTTPTPPPPLLPPPPLRLGNVSHLIKALQSFACNLLSEPRPRNRNLSLAHRPVFPWAVEF